MVTIPLGLGDWESPAQNILRVRLRNMYLIDNPQSADDVSRIGRPTLTRFKNFSSSPVVGAFQQEGVLSGVWLMVAGTTLWSYNGTSFTNIGTISGTDYPQFAATADRVLITRGGTAYAYDGTTLSTIVMPDSRLVESVASINGFFILTEKDSDRFYWIEPSEVNPTALDFATAERIPDNIVSVNVIGDEIWFLGSFGVEVWTPTGDSDDPFIRIPARVYDESCEDKTTVRRVTYKSSPALMWVNKEGGVVLAQGRPQIVSNTGVEESIRGGTNFRSWSFKHLRSNFYILTADEFTYVLDIEKGVWSRWDSVGQNNWRAHLGFQVNGSVYGFDTIEGTIWSVTEGETDNGDNIVMECSGYLPMTGRPEPCYNVAAFINAGWTGSYTTTPNLELRWSDDNGATFSDYMALSVGDRGKFSTDLWFRSLGLMKSPGRYFEFRYSGPAPFRLDFATINEE